MIKKGCDIMKKIYDFCLSATLILMLLLLFMSGLRLRDENLASRISPKILRFHVIANSDSPADQRLKLEIKDLLLKMIRTENQDSETTKEELVQFIENHRRRLEQASDLYMENKGFLYKTDICLESRYFPEKTYGDMTFPAGIYEAVSVRLGEGNGKNFWCVLYPALCYMDSTYAVMPDSSKETLCSLISEDDFLSLLSARHPSDMFFEYKETKQESSLPRLNIRFKLLEYIGETRKSQE